MSSVTMKDRLINEFAESYLEKIFYFCLRKTGSSTEAEDLSQDIALAIISALNDGTIPTAFSGWVWQIARNRYALWADKKHRRSEALSTAEVSDLEIADESENILDEMIRSEQLSLLRRELAFIKSDYRNIIVAYYLENKSLREISASLSLPIETLKKRLQRARNILKEGMHMAREFGVRSYKPEEVYFTNSCTSFGANGQPWTILSHAMYKNIFLEAYGNPSTAEELSLELGVALPYMEDELKFLKRETFLLKDGNKYETAFPIISREAQQAIRIYNDNITARLTHLLEKMIDRFIAACEKNGFSIFGKTVSYADAKWTLLMHAFDILLDQADPLPHHSYTKRPNGGNWDIVGFQEAKLSNRAAMGLHGWTNRRADLPSVCFNQFKFYFNGMDKKHPEFLTHEEAYALVTIARGNGDELNLALVEKLKQYGYIETENGRDVLKACVFDKKMTEEAWASLSAADREAISADAAEIRKMLADSITYGNQIITEDLPPRFRDDERLSHFACQHNRIARNAVLAQAMDDAWIVYDDTTGKTVGAYLYV